MLGRLIAKSREEKDFLLHLSNVDDIMKTNISIPDWKYKSTYDIIIKLGRWFKPTERPADMVKGADKECYRNAGLLAIEKSKELVYVEGFADSGFFPMPHAWCVNKKGHVIETTWSSAGKVYFGIPFNTEFLNTVILKRKKWGVIPDYLDNKKYNPLKDGFNMEDIYD